MKLKLLLIITVIFAAGQAKSQEAKKAGIKFQKQKHNFHRQKAGSEMVYIFTFTNTGYGDLLINDVSSSCGCTVPEWPVGPLGPGQTGTIKVVYDSGRIGKFKKELTVYSNAGIVKLQIKGTVVAAPAAGIMGFPSYMARNLSKVPLLTHFNFIYTQIL